MKKIDIYNAREAMLTGRPEVTLDDAVLKAARRPIDKMFELMAK